MLLLFVVSAVAMLYFQLRLRRKKAESRAKRKEQNRADIAKGDAHDIPNVIYTPNPYSNHYLKSQVAQNNRLPCSEVAHNWLKVAPKYRRRAFPRRAKQALVTLLFPEPSFAPRIRTWRFC